MNNYKKFHSYKQNESMQHISIPIIIRAAATAAVHREKLNSSIR